MDKLTAVSLHTHYIYGKKGMQGIQDATQSPKGRCVLLVDFPSQRSNQTSAKQTRRWEMEGIRSAFVDCGLPALKRSVEMERRT